MICQYCNKPAIWTENKAIYGKNYGKSYMCYYCKPCNAYVGCHRNSRLALGTLANAELREYRKKAHAHFDPIWKNRSQRNRGRLYEEISRHFGKDIHIGESDIQTCKDIIVWCIEKTKSIRALNTGILK